jgi:excisionase family DNA binding protein
MATKEFLTVREVQEMLGISKSGVYRLLHTEGFPALKIGNLVKVRRTELEAWLEAQKIGGEGQ